MHLVKLAHWKFAVAPQKISDIVYKMMKTKEPYDRELAIRNIMKRSQKANNLRRASMRRELLFLCFKLMSR
jgi:hypothetical protein